MAIGSLLVSLGVVGSIAGAVIDIVVGLGLSFIVRRMSMRDAANQQPQGTQVTLRTGGVVPCSFIHGTWATAGSLGYGGTWGNDGNTPNAYMTIRYDLSDLPSDDLVGLVIDGEAKSWNTSASGDAQMGIPVPGYNNKMWVKFYRGNQTVADSFLLSKFGSRSFAPYTSRMIGRGITYAIVTCRLDEELFPNGFPKMLFVVKGSKMYNVRNDSTAGGSGGETYGDIEDAAEVTDNPMVVAYNVMRGITYNGQWFYGGQTFEHGQFPFDPWAAAMNECDALVGKPGGGTERQFTCGGEILLDMEPASVIEALLTSCNGRLAEAGGTYKPRVGGLTAGVFEFTDADVLIEEGTSFDPFRPFDQSVNGVTGQYCEPDAGWDWRPTPAINNSTYEAEDGNRRLMVNVQYDKVKSSTQAQRLNAGALAEARAERSHVVPLPPEANVIEPMDGVVWTSGINGYSNKLFSVERMRRRPDRTVELVLLEADPAAYDPPALILDPIVPPVIVRPPAQSILSWDAEPIAVEGAEGAIKPGILISWGTGVDDVNGVQYEVRLAADDSMVYAGETDRWDLGFAIVTANLSGSTQYKVRGRYRPASPRTVNWSDYIFVTTPAGSIPSTELGPEISSRIQQIAEQFPQYFGSLQDDLNSLASSVASQVTTLMDNIAWTRNAVGARYNENRAGVLVAQEAIATVNSALAQLFVDLYAITADGEAQASFRISAASVPEGALASAIFQLRAGSGDNWTSAALEIIAYADEELGAYSRIRLLADYLDLVIQGVTLPGTLLGVYDVIQAPVTGGDIQVDLSSRRLGYKTVLNANADYLFPAGARPGFEWTHYLEEDNTGGRTVTFGSEYIDPPSLTLSANALNIIEGKIVSVDPPIAAVVLWKVMALSGSLPVSGSVEYSTPGTYTFIIPVHSTIIFEGWGGGGGGGGGGINANDRGTNGGTTRINLSMASALADLVAGGGQGGGGRGIVQGGIYGPGGTGGVATGGTTDNGGSGNQSGQNGNNGNTNTGGKGGNGGGTGGGAGGPQRGPTTGQFQGANGSAPGGGGSGGVATGPGGGGGGGGGAKVNRIVNAGPLGVGQAITIVIAGGGNYGHGYQAGGLGAAGKVRISWS